MYGPDEDKMFAITYEQALGREPLEGDNLFNIRKVLGKKLLPEDGNEYLGSKSKLSGTDKKAYFDSLTKYKVTRKDGSSFIVSSGHFNSLDDVKDAYKYDSGVSNIEVYKR